MAIIETWIRDATQGLKEATGCWIRDATQGLAEVQEIWIRDASQGLKQVFKLFTKTHDLTAGEGGTGGREKGWGAVPLGDSLNPTTFSGHDIDTITMLITTGRFRLELGTNGLGIGFVESIVIIGTFNGGAGEVERLGSAAAYTNTGSASQWDWTIDTGSEMFVFGNDYEIELK